MDQDRRKAWGFSYFADDIRAEMGGKTTLVGMYQGDLVAQGTFPLILPKFVVLIAYYEIKGGLDTDIVFRLSLGAEDTMVAELSVSRKDLAAEQDTSAALLSEAAPEETHPEDSEKIFHMRIPMVLSPFVLPSGGRLRVRARYSDGAVLKLGSLALRVFTPEEFTKFTEPGSPANPSLN